MQTKHDILKTSFGYDTFRPGQESLIDTLLAGGDAVGIMPTGAGKSLCFQIPALLLEGLSLVVSPLISLMKDQVGALSQAEVPAAFLNSALTISQQARVLQNAEQGHYKLLYVAPERLLAPEFLEFCREALISMVCVDEAHCVSQWGQDFRPSYLKISEFLDFLPQRPVVGAFTATATAQVRDDMIALLGLREPLVMTTGFDRPNLYFEVQNPSTKAAALLTFVKAREERSGIVYCLTRKSVEEVCETLQNRGYAATRYHAGLTDAERRENQEAFQTDEAKIMVATNAFGMGIDKSNISYVVHYNMPKNMEAYYQEAGRAGRDGSPAECVLFYSGQDVVTNQFLLEKSSENAELSGEELEAHKVRERERLRQMTFYCHTTTCLRSYILRYFGEPLGEACGNCGNCLDDTEQVDITVDAQKILSCVKRMGERYGVALLVQTLRGSKRERITQLGLDGLRTYGIMADTPEARLREMVNHLVLNSYLTLTTDEFPVLRLGPKARGILFGGETLAMRAPRKKPKKEEKPRRTGSTTIENPRLYAKLQALRARLAKAQSVPAYVIFPDATLREMCKELPQTPGELLGISGVGRAKLSRYGEAFLEVLRAEGEEDTPPPPPVENAGEALTYREELMANGMQKAFSRWNDEEDARLREEFAAELTTEEIADNHARTPYAIRLRLEKLGLAE